MVVADLHYLEPSFFEGSELLRLSAEQGDGKLPHYSQAWLDALVAEAIAAAPDALIMAGDLTYNGEVLSHRAVSDALRTVQDQGISVLVIPGNHDINNDNAFAYLPDGYKAIHSLSLSRYGKYYEELGPAQAFSRDAASNSYAVALTDVLWVLMLDVGVFEPFAEAFGLVEASTEAWMETVFEAANAAGVELISVSHQGMLPHSEGANANYLIVNWESISDMLIRYGVRLNLSGHLHIQHIAERDGFYDVATSSLSMSPNQYGWVTYADDGTIRYETRQLSDAFLPEGLLDESRAFMLVLNERKALHELRHADATDAQKEAMAALFAAMNTNFYAGTLHDVRDTLLADDAFALWRTLGADTRWGPYIERQLATDMPDMNALVIR